MIAAQNAVASTSQLLAAGHTQNAITRFVANGTLIHLRQGWYCVPTCPADVQQAVRLGGRLTGHTFFFYLGAWVPTDHRTHIAFPSGSKRPHTKSDSLIVSYYRNQDQSLYPFISFAVALRHLLKNHADEYCMTIIDSLLNRRLVTRSELEDRLRSTGHGRRLLSLIDETADSGGETMVRLRLRSLRISLRTQVLIEQVGRVDLLIGDRLVIEVDGYEFHKSREAFENDRRRDQLLHTRGYRVLRLTYQQIDQDWDSIQHNILYMVRTRQHRWPRRVK